MEASHTPVDRQPRAAASLVGEALLTLVALGVAWLALDDITTDSARAFRLEYTLLAAAGAWLTVFVVRLWRSGRAWLAGVSLTILLAATWVAADGIGHARDGGWAAFWPEYSTVTLAWVTFTAIAIALLVAGRGQRGRERSRASVR